MDYKEADFHYAKNMMMHRVLLICLQPLLSEGLVRIFGQLENVTLIRLASADSQAIENALAEQKPHVVVIAGQDEDDSVDHLISGILKHSQNLPIVWIGIEKNVMRVYSAQTLPASSNQLIAAIHQAAILNDESMKTDGGDTNVHSK